MMPSAGPRSQCGCGVNANAGAVPTSRTNRLSLSSGPTGTSGCGRFGSSISAAVNASSAAATCCSASAMRSPSARISATTRSRSSGGSLPTVFDVAARVARICSASVISLRRRASASSTASIISGGVPTVASERFTSSGRSRISLMSSMGLLG